MKCSVFSVQCVSSVHCTVFSVQFKEQILLTYIVIWDVLHNVLPPNILHLEVSPDEIVDNDDVYDAHNGIDCHD